MNDQDRDPAAGLSERRTPRRHVVGEDLRDSNHTAAAAMDYLSTMRPDEPVFVLRAQDLLAPDIIRAWANEATVHNCPLTKTGDAHECANEMEAWPTRKYPD